MKKEAKCDVFCLVSDFLASDPTTEELLAFKFTDEMQERLGYLLYQNREAELTCEERHELNDYMRANRMLKKMKIKTEWRMRGLPS